MRWALSLTGLRLSDAGRELDPTLMAEGPRLDMTLLAEDVISIMLVLAGAIAVCEFKLELDVPRLGFM